MPLSGTQAVRPNPDSRFQPPETYRQPRPYRLLPFRFTDFGTKRLLVNDVGEHLVLEADVFDAFVSHRLRPADRGYLDLKSRHFLWDTSLRTPLRLLTTQYRTKKSFLAGGPALHIFVVTLRCDHSCHYCQVSRVSADRQRYDMSTDAADRALAIAFSSPSPVLKIEFQGGEPLLNFGLIEHVVKSAERRAEHDGRTLELVIATNLAYVSDEVLTYCRDHHILISTSLDGPEFLHNAHRPRPGNDSYQLTIRGLERARQILGFDRVSALMTTSRRSLAHPREIVDEYVRQGFDRIFLRPISPYGFAVRSQRHTGYDVEAFLTFYRAALNYILELNRNGTFFVEEFARILLTKILTPFPVGYVDLQSPAGAAIGVLVYNYDGGIHASDESRMLAEMGDQRFRLGNVFDDSYADVMRSPAVMALVQDSVVESLPGCAECAFQAYCGADPIENYATQGTTVGHRPTSAFHLRNAGIIRHLFECYYDKAGDREVLWSWVNNRPVGDLVPAGPASSERPG